MPSGDFWAIFVLSDEDNHMTLAADSSSTPGMAQVQMSDAQASAPGAIPTTPCRYPEERGQPGSAVSKQEAESEQDISHAVIGIDESPQDENENRERQDVDRGVRAWLVLLGAWCCSFCSYGWINSVGTFQEYYETGPLQNYSSSQISWIPSLQIFFVSFLGPVIGQLFDRFGPGYLLLAGSLMHVFGLMMASISTQYFQFLLSQGVCSAIGVAAVFISAIGCVSGWFDKRRGAAFGILATGSSIGGVVFPVMLNKLINQIGYGWAIRTSAFIIGLMLVIANLTIRIRVKPRLMKLSGDQLRQPFREKPFIYLLVGLALVPFGLYTPINYLPTVAIQDGMTQGLAQNLVTFYNAASLVGRISSGFLADKYGRFNAFICACYVAGILIMAMWVPTTNNSTVVAFSVLFGLSSGAYIALMAALVSQLSPMEEIGYRNGLTNLSSAWGGLLANPIAGAILQTGAGATGLKVYAGIFMLAGTTGVVAARFVKTGRKLKVAF